MKTNISRRSIVRGAAWSVPAVAVVAAAPAYAASNGPLRVTISTSCSGRTGTFTVNVTGLDPGQTVRITLTNGDNANGTFTATGGTTGAFAGQTGTTFTVAYAATNNGTASGTITATYTNNQGATQTVLATATNPPSTTALASASIAIRREGNSANYVCA